MGGKEETGETLATGQGRNGILIAQNARQEARILQLEQTLNAKNNIKYSNSPSNPIMNDRN